MAFKSQSSTDRQTDRYASEDINTPHWKVVKSARETDKSDRL